MSDELSILVKAQLDLSDLQSQLSSITGNKNNNIKINVDTKDAQAQVKALKDSLATKAPAKIAVDVNKTQSNANISAFINSIQSRFQNNPIKLTFDVDKKTLQENIKTVVEETQKEIQKVQQAVANASRTNTTTQNHTTGTQTTSNLGQPVLDQSTGGTNTIKYVDELTKAVERYGDAFADSEAKVAKWRITTSDLGGQTALVEFTNQLGETTDVLFRWKEIIDETTGEPTGMGQWVQSGETFSKSFKDTGKEIEATLTKLQRYENVYNNLLSSISNQKNPLTGDFEKNAIESLSAYHKEIEAIRQSGQAMTAEQERNLIKLQNTAKTTITEQRAGQSKSLSDQLGLEKAKDDIQALQNELNKIQLKAFEGSTNRLTGTFAKPVKDSITDIQGKIDSLSKGATVNNLDETIQKTKELKNELIQLNLLRQKQQNTQYQSQKLASTDIAEKIPILRNEVTSLENKLKTLGFSDKFKTQVDELRNSLKTIGKEGGASVQDFNSKLERLKSDINVFSTRTYGKGLTESTNISNNQLAEIENISKAINKYMGQTGATDGLVEARDKVKALADEYRDLQRQLSSNHIGEKRFASILGKESVLDQQLKDFQTLAKNLSGGEKSQHWIATQQTGIQKLKNDFAEYQKQLSETIQLTPELQSKVDAFAQTLGKEGGVDIVNLQSTKDQFAQLQSQIDAFKNSVQGQASQLTLGIQTGELEKINGLVETLSNTQYQGSGVTNLINNLNGLSAKYQEVISQLQNPNLTRDEFNKLAEEVKELGNQLEQAANKAKIFKGGVKNDSALRQFEQQAEQLRTRFEQLKNTYADLAKSNPQIASRFNDLGNQINNVDPANIKEVSRELNVVASQCANASGQAAGLRGALTDAFGGFGSYLARFTSAYYIITKVTQAIKSMVSEVRGIDTSMVELQKVTDLSGDSLNNFVDQSYELGKTVGRTGKDVMDAVTTFSRAGYDLTEATQLAQSALVMTNVGVDIKSTEDAASDMISILKAYDKQASESMQVIDELYNVANKEPLDFGNITQMLVTAGGTLAQTGTSLEETMGLLTGAFATLRDTSVSNG